MNRKTLLAVLACAASLTKPSVAEQYGVGHYVSGMMADFSMMAPTAPGLYFANVFNAYNDGNFSGSKGLPFGSTIGLGVKMNTYAEVPVLMYGYPFDFLGGQLSSGISLPYVWVDVKASGTIDRNGVQKSVSARDKTSGLGDIEIMPIMAGWTNGDFKFSAFFNIFAPSGEYDQDHLANPGLGYWTFEPMLSLSWLSSKIGTEFTLYAAVDFNTENTEADYQSGDIFHVDATLAQHLPLAGGIAGAGPTAFYLKQITGDSGSSAKLGGFEAESYGVGPTISYVRKFGKSALLLDASWLPQLHTKNTPEGNFIWVKAMWVF